MRGDAPHAFISPSGEDRPECARILQKGRDTCQYAIFFLLQKDQASKRRNPILHIESI